MQTMINISETDELIYNNIVKYVINNTMRTIKYEHILARKYHYLTKCNKASLSIISKIIKGKLKTINSINQLKPLAISEITSNMLEPTLLHYIDLNKKQKNLTKTQNN
jgi:hypothetical protein